jgi:hypothetical protein
MFSIYKIEHKSNPELVYVGSTSNFENRKRSHKHDCILSEIKVYQMIRENGGWDKFDMIELKQIECTQLEAREEEDRVRIELNATLNTLRAVKDPNYKQDHKKYYQEHREELNQRTRQYKQAHREQIKQKIQEYRQEHREDILRHQNEKFTCECSGRYTRCHKLRHLTSQKHIAWTQSTLT